MEKKLIKKSISIGIILLLIEASTIPILSGNNYESKDESKSKITGLLYQQIEDKTQYLKNPPIDHEIDITKAIENKKEQLLKQKIFLYFTQKPYNKQIEELEDLGVSIDLASWIPPLNNHPFGFLTADMPIDKLEEIADKEYIKMIDTAEQIYEPQNDQAVIWSNVNNVWTQGYDGTGVTIAVLDSGLDVNHPDIPTPIGSYDYAENDNTIGNTVTGHGTHVAGSALGRGTQSAGQYSGVAPGANLVFLKIGTDSTGGAPSNVIVDAMHDAVDVYNADIVTISYGSWSQYHDGSTATAQAADYAFSQGAVVFCSAGNDANDDRHFSGAVAASGVTNFIRVNVNNAGTNSIALAFNLVWFDGLGTNNDLELEYYDAAFNQLLATTISPQSESPRGTESQYSRYNFYVPAGSSTYYLRVINNDPVNQFYHIYYDSRYNLGNGQVTFQNPDPLYTLGGTASADNAIAVGSHTTRANWANFLGNVYTFNQVVDTISTFSSQGPRVDNGVPKVNIVAPGSATISVRDQDVYSWTWPNPSPPNYYALIVDNDGLNLDGSGPADYYVMQGTSMSTPHAAGIAALLLQAFPGLVGNPSAVKCMLEMVAGNRGLHDPVSGYGLIDAEASINPIVLGLCWLCSIQNVDGSWTYSGRITEENVGLTAMATLAFLNYGINELYPVVSNAINWIITQQKVNGKITTGTYDSYDTALAILALVATRNNDYYDEIQSAVNFLIDLQNDAGEGYTNLDPLYGGWPYWEGHANWADLSNSQFVLLALHYAEEFESSDQIIPNVVWSNAELFVTNCQNREISNPNYNFFDDGGFIYMPSSTTWGGGNSYASMTTAGLWGLYTTNVPSTDGRVQDAWTWIENNYYVDQNFPLGNLFLYYYLYGLAKASILWNVDIINGHDWYDEMTQVLFGNQQTDGHWLGTDPDEEPDNVATCWALLALISKIIPPGTGLNFQVNSPVDLHVYDPQGRHVGINYTTGLVEVEIPGASYSGPGTEPQIIDITIPIAGTYYIKLVGTGNDDYTYTVRGMLHGQIISEESYTSHITIGEIHESTSVVSALAGAITIESNTYPLAITGGPYKGIVKEPVIFNSMGSIDPDGTIVSYEWDFGDGTTGSGVTTIHRYDTLGTYNVILTVTDNDGATDSDTTTVEITHGNPPSVQLIYPTGGETLKDTVTIRWSAHDSKDGDNLPIYLFYSDDDNLYQINNVLENTGEYQWDTTMLPDGTYTLLVQAIDNDGNIGHDQSKPFEIDNYYEPENNPPNKPTKPSGPSSGKAGEEYTYTSSTTDPDGDQIWYKWDFGDGTTSGWIGPLASGATCQASHTWEVQGDYNVKVKAKDQHGDESSWSEPLSISMPKSKSYINRLFINFLQNLLQRFPLLARLLQLPVFENLLNQ